MEDKTITKILIEATELSKKRISSNKEFVKTIITIATGFLALFVGLKPEVIPNEIAKILFLLTTFLLVIGIIFCAISLYVEVYFHDQNMTFLKKTMEEHLEKSLTYTKLNTVKKPWLFKLLECFGFLFLGLSGLSLILYIYFIETPFCK